MNEHTQSGTLILGSGSSGLGVALGLNSAHYKDPVVHVEKKDRPGGLAGSFDWKTHTIDYGPHRLAPNLDQVRSLAQFLLGSDCLVKKSQHGVFLEGKLYQFPPRVGDWLSPRSLTLLLHFGASFLASKLAWVVRRFETDTFPSVIERKFGKAFLSRVVRPMCEKVWTRAEEIDPLFATQRFAQVQPAAVLKKVIFPKQELNPNHFYYPRLGFQQLWDRAAEYLQASGQTLHLGTSLKRLTLSGQRVVQVETQGPQGTQILEVSDWNVVSTIPIGNLLQAIEGLEGIEELRRKASTLRIRSMILVSMEVEGEKALPFRTLIFPNRDVTFNRIFEQNEYSRDCVSPGKSVIVADITVDFESPEFFRKDEDIIQKTVSEVMSLPFMRGKKILDAQIKRIPYAYVVPDGNTRRVFAEIQFALSRVRNLFLCGRFSIGEYDNSDYAIDQGVALAEHLAGRSTQVEYFLNMERKRGRPIVG